MKDFDIRDYIWNIYEISAYYNLKSLDSAFDMFTENLILGYERYSGASLDYTKLSKVWNNLPKSYRTYEKIIFKKVLDASYSKLCELWNKKDKSKFISICKSIRLNYGIRKE